MLVEGTKHRLLDMANVKLSEQVSLKRRRFLTLPLGNGATHCRTR